MERSWRNCRTMLHSSLRRLQVKLLQKIAKKIKKKLSGIKKNSKGFNFQAQSDEKVCTKRVMVEAKELNLNIHGTLAPEECFSLEETMKGPQESAESNNTYNVYKTGTRQITYNKYFLCSPCGWKVKELQTFLFNGRALNEWLVCAEWVVGWWSLLTSNLNLEYVNQWKCCRKSQWLGKRDWTEAM